MTPPSDVPNLFRSGRSYETVNKHFTEASGFCYNDQNLSDFEDEHNDEGDDRLTVSEFTLSESGDQDASTESELELK